MSVMEKKAKESADRNKEIDERVFSLTGKTEEQIMKKGTPLEKACLLIQNYEAYVHGQKFNLTDEQRVTMRKNLPPKQEEEYSLYIQTHDALDDYFQYFYRYETRTAQFYLSRVYGALHMFDLLDRAERQGILLESGKTKEHALGIAKLYADLLKKRFGRVKAAAQYIRDFMGDKIDMVKFITPQERELCAAFDDKMEEYFFGEDSNIDSFPLDDKYFKAKSKGKYAIIPNYEAVKMDGLFYNDAKGLHDMYVRNYDLLKPKFNANDNDIQN